jgi:ADP-ribose pyrophosphatase
MQEHYYDNDWRIVEYTVDLPNGKQKTATRVHTADSAHIIAFVSDAKILLIREYRPHYGTYIWMLPSGKVDKENDEKAAAQRELQEETGFRSDDLCFYCMTNNAERIIMTNHYYIAKDLHKDPLPQDEDEYIEVHEVSIDDAIANVLSSEVVHTPSAYGLLRYARDFLS